MEGHSTELSNWADKAMVPAAPMPRDQRGGVSPKVSLLWATPDPLGAIAACCRMYEGKPTYNLGDVTDEERRYYWEDVKSTKLQTPYEFVQFHFFIEAVDRSFTHQIVRKRHASFVQESMRFAVKEGMAQEALMPIGILTGGQEAQDAFNDIMKQIDDAYQWMVNNGIPAEDARAILPHAATTRLHYRVDLRSLKDEAGNRLCTQAQFLWRIVLSQLVQSIRTYKGEGHMVTQHRGRVLHEHAGEMYPYEWQFKLLTDPDEGIFVPVCYQVGHCVFKASMDRHCNIRDRVEAGQWDDISTAEWLLDPNSARVARG